MRFLIDMPLSPHIAAWLESLGHDAAHASDLGLARATDTVLLDRAAADARIVVTADTDFPQLLALSRSTGPGVILVRGGDYTTDEIRSLLSRVLAAIPERTLAKSICAVDRRQVRCRALPLAPGA